MCLQSSRHKYQVDTDIINSRDVQGRKLKVHKGIGSLKIRCTFVKFCDIFFTLRTEQIDEQKQTL